jgi:uncharacterized protein (TIGR01777 family)
MGRYAVTGSTGLIGRALVASLEADRHEVVRLVRPGTASSGARWDPEAGTIEAGELEGLDGVVHLAGEGIAGKRWTDEQKRRIIESRRAGTSLLARTLAELESKPPVLVSGSAIGFYGDRGDEVLTEASAPGRGFLTEIVEAWEAAAQPAVDAGIRTVFLRTGIVLAGDGGVLGKLKLLFRLGLGGKLGSGRQWMSPISIADEVAVIRFLLDGSLAGPVNAVAPHPVTNAEFTKAIGAAVHRPTFLAVPRFGPRLLLGRELADNLLFVSQRVEPRALLDAGFEFRHPTIASQVGFALKGW